MRQQPLPYFRSAFYNCDLSASPDQKLSGLAAADITATENVSSVGACAYDRTVTLDRLLSEADLALSAAVQTGANAWQVRTIMDSAEKAPMGQKQWKEALETVLKDRRIALYTQPVVKASDRNIVLHQEIFSRIILEKGEIVNAGIFIPVAERLKLVSALDRMIIEEITKLDRNELGADTIAVNLSPSSLQDESFVEWIRKTLVNLPVGAPKMIFEFPEFGAVQNENLLRSFSAVIRECGHKMGLDHYGQSGGNLKYLQSLRPDYVKIDRAYTGELKDEESDSRFFISSMCSVAHSIDVVVIAEGVETEKQLQLLHELNIDAVQGYIIEKSKPVTKK